MHISRIALVPALLAIAANAFPLQPGNASAASSINEATKRFSEHYTSIVGNGEYTAIAHARPTPTPLDANATSIADAVFKASSSTSTLPSRTATLSLPPFANITAPTSDYTILQTDDLLSNPLILEAIRSDLETYNTEYGPPTEAERECLPAREQIMVENLFHFIDLLPCEERAAAEAIAELVLQKALRANVTSEAEDLDNEEIESIENIVKSLTSELFRLIDNTDSHYPFTLQACNADGTTDEPRPNDLHALVPRSSKSKSKSPATCPDGSEIPINGIQDCPPLNEWQLAQKQDTELRKHLKKKEKSDRTRDHMRIASTTFASISCVISPVTCGMLAVKGVI
ncbi:hypothetical protein DL98DRAFT_524419 [Cadophora sp. DSE1049]|nr:hypothetical protein DL98DRAFT_524419 [Cadophora sp. DSE1049]